MTEQTIIQVSLDDQFKCPFAGSLRLFIEMLVEKVNHKNFVCNKVSVK